MHFCARKITRTRTFETAPSKNNAIATMPAAYRIIRQVIKLWVSGLLTALLGDWPPAKTDTSQSMASFIVADGQIMDRGGYNLALQSYRSAF